MKERSLIQATQWALQQEDEALEAKLHIYTIASCHFNFQGQSEPTEYFGPDNLEAWSQEFLPNLFIGDICSMIGHYDIRQNVYPKYDHIFDFSQAKSIQQFIQANQNHLQIDVGDTGDNFDTLVTALQTNDVFGRITRARERNERVLINCSAGQSRSATVSILYLMETYKVSFVQAYKHIQKFRPIILPNPGYVFALLEYESKLNGIAPIPFEAAKLWLEEYRRSHAIQHFLPTAVAENKMRLDLNTDDRQRASRFENGFNRQKEFIQLILFLRALNLPFKAFNCNKQGGSVELDKDVYEHLTEIFMTSLPEPKVITVPLSHPVEEFKLEEPKVNSEDLKLDSKESETPRAKAFPNISIVTPPNHPPIKAFRTSDNGTQLGRLMEEKAPSVRVTSVFKYPSSYTEIFNKAPSSLDHLLAAKSLLVDYTKNNSAVCRFFHGHWNRHHTKAVNELVQRIHSGSKNSIDTLVELLNELGNIELNNPKGSLARRIQFITDITNITDQAALFPAPSPKEFMVF